MQVLSKVFRRDQIYRVRKRDLSREIMMKLGLQAALEVISLNKLSLGRDKSGPYEIVKSGLVN